MGFLSVEMTLFVTVLLIYTRLRKKNVLPLMLTRGLIVYIPPTEADFEVLKKSSAEVRTTMKGKKNKWEARSANKKAKLPLRTIPLSEQFLRLCTDNFDTCDFMHMLFVIVTTMSLTVCLTLILQMNLTDEVDTKDRIGTNLSFFLTLFTVFYIASTAF